LTSARFAIVRNSGDDVPTIREAAARIADGRLTSTALTKLCLERIERYDGTLHSFISVAPEQALAAAARADRELQDGRRRGPLHGIPYAAKDVYDTRGLATTGASRAFRDNVPVRDARAISRLEEAGAVLLGKLMTHELTYGGVDAALAWPLARNPWDPTRDPGGSSSGSGAAVAAGLCLAALGTDTGGSIRLPAALCGIVGLKPTYGRVSRHGVMLNSFSLDHCGPMTWTVDDCACMLQAIAGYDSNDPASSSESVPDFSAALGRDIKGVRVGVVSHFWEDDLPADQVVRKGMSAVLEVLRESGAVLRDVNLRPLAEYAAGKVTIQTPEIYSLYGQQTREQPELFGPKFRNRIAPGAQIAAVDYVRAQRLRAELKQHMSDAMADVDVLLTSGPYPARDLNEAAADTRLNKVEITVPFSMTGFPAISICSGFTPEGLPLSIQIVGRPFDEASALRVADAYERATPWRLRRPSL
jgi:aspartyl-tRNA(Asn)/glutamyl-tRNA(Gln) amidotransferase subunit A